MNVHSKFNRDSTQLSCRLEIDMICSRILIMRMICFDIVREMKANYTRFYRNHIHTNIYFQSTLHEMRTPESKKRVMISKQLNSDKATIFLIYFLFEEFYFTITSPAYNEAYSIHEIMQQVEVFRMFLEKQENVIVNDYLFHVPMSIREKSVPAYSIQIMYILSILHPTAFAFPPIVCETVERVLKYYQQYQSIENFCKFDDYKMQLYLTATELSYEIKPQPMTVQMTVDLVNLKFDTIDFTMHIIYAWIVSNPFALKSYNEILLRLYTSIQYEIKYCKDEKEKNKLYKKKYEITHATGKYKYIEAVQKIKQSMI